IGVNLTDGMYQGIYHGKQKHEADLDSVIKRSVEGGVEKLILTGTSLSESKAALEICEKYDNLYCTVGCHPTNCNEFEKDSPEEYYNKLSDLACSNNKKIVALGEFGLDYDRLNFCDMEVQKKYFEWQLKLAGKTHLPLFLHCRKAANDLIGILKTCGEDISSVGGVVHSFDGTEEELMNFLKCGLYIGINGCSLKTEENLKVVKEIPLDRLLIETDAPWCEIRPSHAGYKHIKTKFPSKKYDKWEKGVMVKGRNEPHCIV
ncbi:putative deoxyribonuclease TATDN1, partial [Armadillidium nasatum]